MEEERRETKTLPQGGEPRREEPGNGGGRENACTRKEGEAEPQTPQGDFRTAERTAGEGPGNGDGRENACTRKEGEAGPQTPRGGFRTAERTAGEEPEEMGQLWESLNLEEKRRAEEAEKRAAQAKAQLESLYRQAELLRRSVPDFDLARELENPSFLRLTAPHTGLSLEEAYHALHYREIEEKLARESMLSAVRAVKAGSLRPSELQGGQGASMGCADPKTMSREQREALRKRIYEASAQGKKLPYGG